MPSVSHQLLFSDCVAKAGPVPGTGFAGRLNGSCHRARLLVWAGAQPRPPVGLIAIVTFGQPNTSGFSIYHVAFAKIHPSSSKSFAARLILQAGPWCICACQSHAGACLLDAVRARPVFFYMYGRLGRRLPQVSGRRFFRFDGKIFAELNGNTEISIKFASVMEMKGCFLRMLIQPVVFVAVSCLMCVISIDAAEQKYGSRFYEELAGMDSREIYRHALRVSKNEHTDSAIVLYGSG